MKKYKMIKVDLESNTSLMINIIKDDIKMTVIRYGVKLNMRFTHSEFIQMMTILFNSDKIIEAKGDISFSKLTNKFKNIPVKIYYIDNSLIMEVKKEKGLLYMWWIKVYKKEFIDEIIDPVFNYQKLCGNRIFVVGEGRVCLNHGTTLENVNIIFAKTFIEASQHSGLDIVSTDKKLFTSSMTIERANVILGFKEDECYV